MTRAALYVAFLFSGAAALIFQTLWFRQAGLAFGNSVWASSLVLASFMGGLALGNGLSARFGRRLRHPLRVYAGLEMLVAVTGVLLVFIVPPLSTVLAGVFGPLLSSPLALNMLRLGGAFALMLVPATAMGATLPVLITAMSSGRHDFGRELGMLYGWNTLGAFAGALGGELLLIEALGIRGTGLAAGGLNVLAASAALVLSRQPLRPTVGETETDEPSPEATLAGGPERWLAAGFLSGALVLALEVVWFRFLQLFVVGTSLAFAVMLAVVLLGIALGGFAAGRWLAKDSVAYRFLPVLALGAGLAALLGYASFESALHLLGRDLTVAPRAIFELSSWLMLPTCVISGVIFTLLGGALRERMDGARASGLLTLANTVGGMLGALGGGFLLLPRLGMERSFFLLGFGYVVLALLTGGAASQALPAHERRLRFTTVAAGLLLSVLTLLFFPFGLLQKTYVDRVVARFRADGSILAGFREGLTETILYLRKDLLDQPVSFRLVTNGFSMSGTGFGSERYMTQYVYWPIAVRPESRHAVLISYGVGVTADALARQKGLERVDVVDISRDILEMGRLAVLPGRRFPLDDPRLRVHVEDGRFFLLTTRDRYDLITADPPPPANAGIVNLYSQEYFALIHDRLKEGGLTTYWLPVHSIELSGTKAIIRGFCNVFEDCSLWNGAGLNWMLVGSRGARGPSSESEFTRQWQDPEMRPALARVGLDSPERLGARFLGDAAFLDELTRGAPPLVDDHPLRIGRGFVDEASFRFYYSVMDVPAARHRFETSSLIGALWPPELRKRTLPYFEEVRIFNDFYLPSYGHLQNRPLPLLYEVLTRSDSTAMPLVLLGTNPREQEIVSASVAQGNSYSVLDYLQGVRALAVRDYRSADRYFQLVAAREPNFGRLSDLRTVAWCLGGGARSGMPGPPPTRPRPHPIEAERTFWDGLERDCGLGGSGAGEAARP